LLEFKFYLLQGRALLQADIATESDPFVIITIGDKALKSRTVENSVNPNWGQRFNFNTIIYGSLEDIRKNPPEIIVDVYDEDPFNVKNNYAYIN
jgi:otoferlin